MAAHAVASAGPIASFSEGGAKSAVKLTAREYWSQYLRSVLSPLFKSTGSYTPYAQASHLQFLDDIVVQHLGPRPGEPRHAYTNPSSIVDCPVDISLNFTYGGKTKVRMDFDMMIEPPTEADPFGEEKARQIVRSLAADIKADTRWLEYLWKHLYLAPEDLEAAQAKIPKDLVLAPGMAGFDFDGTRRTLKASIPFMRKALATGKSGPELVIRTLRGLEPCGNELRPSLDMIEGYLSDSRNDTKIVLVGVDCVDPKNARLRCYLTTSSNSFAAAHDVMTLGGRLDNEISKKRVEILRSLWPMLINQPESPEPALDDTETATERISGSIFSGTMVTVEMGPGQPIPDTKIHIPLFQYTDNCEDAEQNVESILKKLGHEWGRTGKYGSAMEAVFGTEEAYGQVYLTFTYNKDRGTYVSSYIAKQVETGEN